MADGNRSTLSQLEVRLERVERALDAISREVTAIRGALGTAPAEPDTTSTAAPPLRSTVGSRPPRAPAERLDLERLLGRYGMLGIATLALLAAVGTFLRWAISHGYLTLTPGRRVIVGLVFAAGIAAWGFKLRRKERPFGSSMIGLALVIVLVCAYAAGPGFALVPVWLAFAGALLVSWTLAMFAHAENDEPLWCVAFGGAAVVPFVTSNGDGNFYGLVVYAAFLLFAACFAISHHTWPVAWRVFYAAAALFALVTASMSNREGLPGFFAAFGLPLAVAAVGVLPFAPAARKKAALRWLAMLTVLVGFVAPRLQQTPPRAAAVAGVLLGAAVFWLVIVDRLGETEQSSLLATNRENALLLDWIDAGVLPLALCFQASSAVEPAASPAIVDAIAAAVFLLFAFRRAIGVLRDAAVAACIVIGIAGLFQLHLEEPTGRVLALLAASLAFLILHKLKPSLSWIAGSVVSLAAAAGITTFALLDRRPYMFPPFGTEASFAALAVTIALVLVVRFRGWIGDATGAVIAARPGQLQQKDLAWMLRVVRATPWVWVFVWGLIELSMAFSQSTSTLLLVIYFAATAVAGVAVGHMRGSAGLRQIGLALALLAAATAVYGATSYFDVGARVLAYLVTSAFLLGIAYWYRRPGVATRA